MKTGNLIIRFGVLVPVLVGGLLQVSGAELAAGGNDATTSPAAPGEASPAAAPLPAPAVTGTDLLLRAMQANEILASDLQSFVCDEKIERFKAKLGAQSGGQHLDTVTTKVSFENGAEQYSDVLQDGKARARLSSLPGAWSEGEYGTLLKQTRDLLRSRKRVFYRSHSEVDGIPAGLYTFEVSEQESPWDLDVKDKHYSIPFRTEVWVAKDSGRVLKIARTSTAMPENTRITELSWSVSLQPIPVNGKTFLLPTGGEYSVGYQKLNRREFNKIEFANYRRYSAEATLKF